MASRISAVAAASIDKTNVLVDKGEMSFALFDYREDQLREIIDQNIKSLQKVKALAQLLGEQCLPGYLVNYIESFVLSATSGFPFILRVRSAGTPTKRRKWIRRLSLEPKDLSERARWK